MLGTALAALACASSPALAAQRTLWPGVTYERGAQLTPNGPVALSILRGPRPGGATTLEPLLSNESLLGRETLTAMQRRLAARATTAGVNGDFFTLSTGRPSGILLREGQLVSRPRSERSSAGITSDGRLEVRRVSFFGAWQGTGVRRQLATMNEAPPNGQAALFTDAYGPRTPLVRAAVAVVLFPFPAAVPNADLVAAVGEVVPSGAPVEIPAGGAVLVGTGAAAEALRTEAVVGEELTLRLQLRPGWPGVVAAIGGGPQIVRDGVPVYRAGEAFTSLQLRPRSARTAIGQLRDGRVIMVAVDGRLPGLSVGLTNFELAQTLVRLGAVTAMALDGGGSTTMAFDGALLNSPSDGRERPISTAVVLAYTGVFVPAPPARVSPNGDGVDDSPALSYRVVRPSTVTVGLVAPDGTTALQERVERQPGTFPVTLPVAAPPTPAAGAASEEPGPSTLAQGRWRLEVSAVDDLGRATAITRSFVVDDTLGHLRVPRRLAVSPDGGELPIAWRLAREATVSVTVVTRSGTVVRTVASGRLGAGDQQATWNGLGRDGKPVAPGAYVVRVAATGPVGRSELAESVTVRRVAAAQ